MRYDSKEYDCCICCNFCVREEISGHDHYICERTNEFTLPDWYCSNFEVVPSRFPEFWKKGD